MKKILVITWLTALIFLLISNVHAWDVPSYLRLKGGTRMWFSFIGGDLVQPDKTKLGITDNLGIRQDQLAWEFFADFRLANIHVLRLRGEPGTFYDHSKNDSYHQVRNLRMGYDLDFVMTPQFLAGANIDLDVTSLKTSVNNVAVAGRVFNYSESDTRAMPSLGFHGTFYPILDGIALRPHVSSRFSWWDYKERSTWDWEVSGAVDIPVNELWTWTINGGYRWWNVKMKRGVDRVDMYRSGFFVETSVLF